jgi:hypothetical protein
MSISLICLLVVAVWAKLKNVHVMRILKHWLKNTLRLPGKWWHSIVLVRGGASSQQMHQNTQESHQQNIYTHCSELPLHNFIQIIISNNLYWLMKSDSGELPANAAEVWDNIFIEYMELTGDQEYRYMMDLILNIEKLRIKVLSVESALNLLSNYKSKPVIEALLELGYTVEQMKDWDDYFKSLEDIHKRLGLTILELHRKEKELQELQKNYGKVKADEKYFTKIVIRLSKYQGYRIDALITTVSEFAMILNSYLKEVENASK